MVIKKASFSVDNTNRSMGKGLQPLVLFAIATFLLSLIGVRLSYIQIVEGDRNRQLAENNRIRLIAKAPERGRILDRHGKIMATNRLSHAIYLWPVAQPKAKWQETITKLAQIIKVPEAEIRRKLEQEGYNSPNKVRISAAISPKLATELGERINELKGVEVDPEPVRYYPNGYVAAHVLGYAGELTEEELNRLKPKGYRLGDIIGKAGVESAFEQKFRGVWGGQQVEVDAGGKVIRILGEKPPIAGNSVSLTIDLELQKVAEAALGNLQGGVIAMNPQNGEVLAMASYPNFDPNIFSGRISNALWQRLTAKANPFVNRTLQGFPPASTYKIITTVAALESGKFSPNDYLNTFPYLEVGGNKFWDHNNAGFGTIGFADAMAYSSDTFFYQVGRRVGIDTLANWTRKFGFGALTGIELKEEESAGLVPDPAWKEKVLKEPWYVGNTINMSIGQGDLQSNLLQVGMMTAVAANGGYLVKPHLLFENTDAKAWRKSLNLAPSTVAVLKDGLRRVITSGTAQALNVSSVAIAGKSGTAEDPPRKSHTWFVGYAPADKPEILVVVFGENSGGGGGSLAGPKVLKVIEAYMRLKKIRKS
jgi:penicillin-binding protein 2